ncbi:TetR/AcrR family transcriptional regulator [Pseudomonas migulae]
MNRAVEPKASRQEPSKAEFIRSVALRLFVNEGYQSVSLRHIADQVGMQAGSLYNHIESKQTLLFDFIQELEYRLLHSVTKYPITRFDVRAALANYVGYYLRFSIANRDLHILSRREICSLTQVQKNSVESLRAQQAARLEEIIEIGQSQDVFFVENERVAANAILAMLDGVIGGALGDDLKTDVLIRLIQSLIYKSLSATTS